MSKRLFLRVCSTALLCLGAGCAPSIEEKLNVCDGSQHLATARLFGRDLLILKAEESSSWLDLAPEHIPPLASAMTIEGLRRERGAPDKEWQIDDRPYVLYQLSEGTLQFGLEASRSGSLEHRVWRLRWREKPVKLSEVLPAEVMECIDDLTRQNQQVLLAKENDSSAPSIIVEAGLVVEWAWSRRYEWNQEDQE